MSVVLLPNNELVAVSWLSSIAGLEVDGIATQLPSVEASWKRYGFVTVAVVGGSPENNTSIRRPVYQVDCWANNKGSDKPPWWRANVLAEQIRAATFDRQHSHRGCAIAAGGASYPNVIVLAATMMTEPRRGYGDPGDYARYQFDLQMWWTQVPEYDP
jgi:hypothetical protein